MKPYINLVADLILFSFFFIVAGSSPKVYGIAISQDDKMPVSEFVVKHLDSIGTAEARKAVKSITIVGTNQAVFKGRGEGRAEGIVVLASQAEKSMIGMKFNNSDYPHEKLGFDGNNFTVDFVRPGEYTIFGQFLRINEKTFKSGILGGSLSTSWELFKYDENIGKLKSKGKTRIDGVELLRFDYNIKKGSDLDITLFFDASTYRHVRTEYKRVISGGQGLSVDTSSRQNETRYKMVEEFTDFRDENTLKLPHSYSINLELLTGTGTTSYKWTMNLQQFKFNQNLDVGDFKFGS